MTLTGPFVLHPAVALQPVSELTEQLRRDSGAADGDFALTRASSRSHSKLVNSEAAALVRQFETPCTIAVAIARFSRGKPTAPEKILEEAFPFLQSLITGELLVPADSVGSLDTGPSLASGSLVDRWTIVRCIQALEDTELYQASDPQGRFAALKIATSVAGPARSSILHEAQILNYLDRSATPRCLGQGEAEGRPYLVTEWCPGTDAFSAAAEFRNRKNQESRACLLHLAVSILDAYARLHQQGVVHGDVHPQNLLIDRSGAVTIIDFGFARFLPRDGRSSAFDPGERKNRGGVSFFFEPEFASRALRGLPSPPASFHGEQAGLAALLYLLLTGSHYLNFSLERDKMLRQIAEAPMAPFAGQGVEPWPEVEQHLARALSKDPNARFPSVAAFSHALRSAKIPPCVSLAGPPVKPRLEILRADLLQKFGLPGPLLNGGRLPAPTASVNYGSAGIGYGLYRLACAEENAELLALADLWSTKAVREMEDNSAFYNPELEMTPEKIGRTSLYHSPSGVYAVQALIAQARGDIALACRAAQAFIQVCQHPCEILDLALGRAGMLLGCVFLLDAFLSGDHIDLVREQRSRLIAQGRAIRGSIWRTIADYAPIPECHELRNTGIAHGWAGLLYATLCWSTATGDALPDPLPQRLDQLARCAEPSGRGLRWNWYVQNGHLNASAGVMPGWCNGSAGYVFLWTEAHQAFAEKRFLDLAEGAAWHAWETPQQVGNLCCGMAGQAYALLNFSRYSRDPVWQARARDLAIWAAAAAGSASALTGPAALELRPESLYKGDVGIAILAADLNDPEHACMPLFERQL
jgi:eukaryotic-like serine/threonine-protein kinase